MPGTYEGKLSGRRDVGVWDTLGTSRGHASMDAARDAALKLADRRGLTVVDDPRALRMVNFRDTYGDDV